MGRRRHERGWHLWQARMMTGETKVNFALCVCRVVLYAGLSVAGAMSARLAQRASAAMRALSLSLTVRLKKGRRDRRRDERRQIYCWSRDHSETPTFGLCDVIASVLILAMHGEFFFCCCCCKKCHAPTMPCRSVSVVVVMHSPRCKVPAPASTASP